MTPSGIEPATFRLVAQCLKQLRHQQRAPLRMCNGGRILFAVDNCMYEIQILLRISRLIVPSLITRSQTLILTRNFMIL